jgi:UDP-N-acetylglucosamine 2-epimerase (non-hydrolysing)
MKILTITGTRPELIRLSVILAKLDALLGEDHVHVYTNQNYDPNLSTIFLRDLRIKKPKYTFGKTNGIGQFLGMGFTEFNIILDVEKPDKILVLGDTNSVLFAILAAKRGIPIYHMEAGNRCYDGAVPEETNRRVIDACSLFNLPYTKNSKENLINEGFSKNFVFQTGNPIKEVLQYYEKDIANSDILVRLGLAPYTMDAFAKFALLSFHRTENVDTKSVAKNVVEAINQIAEEGKMKVVFPFHPRTKDQFAKHGLSFSDRVMCIDPIGFFDFVRLEQFAHVVITDSGTVPEETALFGKPCIVLRNTTERQELMETGSWILAGTNKDDIVRAFRSIDEMRQVWPVLDDYSKVNVSDTVIRILMGQKWSITRKGHDEY